MVAMLEEGLGGHQEGILPTWLPTICEAGTFSRLGGMGGIRLWEEGRSPRNHNNGRWCPEPRSAALTAHQLTKLVEEEKFP